MAKKCRKSLNTDGLGTIHLLILHFQVIFSPFLVFHHLNRVTRGQHLEKKNTMLLYVLLVEVLAAVISSLKSSRFFS